MQLAQFSSLLSKEMTRREFLVHVGVLLLVITGVSGLLKTLSDPHLSSSNNNSARSRAGFGSGPYGG